MSDAAIVAYLDERFGSHNRARSEREYACPFCDDRIGSSSSAHKKKLRVNVAKGVAFCHRCGYKAGSLAYLVRDLNGGSLSFEERRLLHRKRTAVATVSLATQVRAVLTPPSAVQRQLRAVPLPDEALPIRAHDRRTARGLEYLLSRGAGLDDVERYDIHYCPKGPYALYVIFPVMQHGVQVYWTNRYTGECPWHTPPDKFRKTLNVPQADGEYGKSDCLFGFDQAVHDLEHGHTVLTVTEGPFDALAAPATVALLGKLPSAAQLRLLRELVGYGFCEVVDAIDPDAARESDALRRALGGFVSVSRLPLGNDDLGSQRARVDDLYAGRTAAPSLADRVRRRLTS